MKRLLGLSLIATALGGCGREDAHPAQLQALRSSCESAMLEQVCRVSNGASQPTAAESTVFVAGTGAVDAKAYAQLVAAGANMCKTVVDACRSDWEGTRCKTSRALFASVPS